MASRTLPLTASIDSDLEERIEQFDSNQQSSDVASMMSARRSYRGTVKTTKTENSEKSAVNFGSFCFLLARINDQICDACRRRSVAVVRPVVTRKPMQDRPIVTMAHYSWHR